jgi:hypothetical protein
MTNLSIDVWTINFWIKENAISFDDNQITEIFNLNPPGGSIFMLKDADNLFKVMYVVLWKWRVDLEYDVSNLAKDKRHMITVIWNIKDSLALSIDWIEVKKEKTNFK